MFDLTIRIASWLLAPVVHRIVEDDLRRNSPITRCLGAYPFASSISNRAAAVVYGRSKWVFRNGVQEEPGVPLGG